jgi:hypothetical protein
MLRDAQCAEAFVVSTHRYGPAWRKATVRPRIWARRFFCSEPRCERKIFAERFANLLPRHGRRTGRVTRLLVAIAQRGGGQAGARLAPAVGVPTSPHTLRRTLRRRKFLLDSAPTALGVDEFALA